LSKSYGKTQGFCLLLHGYHIEAQRLDVFNRSVAGVLDLHECFTAVVGQQISDRAFDVSLKNIDCVADYGIFYLSQRIIHDLCRVIDWKPFGPPAAVWTSQMMHAASRADIGRVPNVNERGRLLP
jgi:hypothetical protein